MQDQSHDNRKVIRVFISSAGDLKEERHRFREIIDEVNRSKAYGSGIQLETLGWENTVPGIGRPQGLINQSIEKCDLMIMLLWKYWGKETGEYSSEFEEEYELAKRLHEKNKKPDIMLYFRNPPDNMMNDIGPQLQQVLEFKKKIESERKFLYKPYEDENEWEKSFREHLSRWLDGFNESESGINLLPSKSNSYDDSLFEVTTLDALYELTTNEYFLEKPLQKEEWKSKRNVVNFDEKWIETARSGLTNHQILLITGPPNIGKSTFLLFYLSECMEIGNDDWDAVIFLNPSIKEEELDSVLEDFDTLIQSEYEWNNILLVVDGLRRREDDKNYLNKSIKLFKKAGHHGCKIIVTLRDSEKDFLKNELKNLNKWEWGIDQWEEIFKPKVEEIVLSYNRKELENIILNYLNYYEDKIDLQGISFDEIGRFYNREEIPLEKEKQYLTLKGCIENIIDKSEGLAGYIAFLLEDIAKNASVFSDEIVKKYPIGMTNLILNTISRDFYIERNYIKNDNLIPLFIMLLIKLDYPMTEHFFDSIEVWGSKALDKTLGKEDKVKITDKINNFRISYTFYTTFMGEVNQYRLLDSWKDAINEAIHNGIYDRNYSEVVKKFEDMEGNLKYWIERYVYDKIKELENRNEEFFSDGHLVPEAVYLIGDLAKLEFMNEINTINTLDISTKFFKEHRQKNESLSRQFDFLKKTLIILWNRKAKRLMIESSYEKAIEAYEEIINLDSGDSRAYWGIGTCCEILGKNDEAIEWYIQSAYFWDTPQGYTNLIRKVEAYIKKFTLLDDDKLKYLEIEENAALISIGLDAGYYISWSQIAQIYKSQGIILKNSRKKYYEAISKFNKAIKAYLKVINGQQFQEMRKEFYYQNVGYCFKNLAYMQKQLRNHEESRNCLLEYKKNYLKSIEIITNEFEYIEDKEYYHKKLVNYYRDLVYCYRNLGYIEIKLHNYEESRNCFEISMDYFKLSAEIENNTIGHMRLAKIMLQKRLYSENEYTCEEVLEKTDRNELELDELIYYCYIRGIDFFHKKNIDDALKNFAEAKTLIFSKYSDNINITVLDDYKDLYILTRDLHKYLGLCYEEQFDNRKAADNYIVYIDLNEYTSKSESGQLYYEYGVQFLDWGYKKEAKRCFHKLLKRNQQNTDILILAAIANARFGCSREVICNLDALGSRISDYTEKKLYNYTNINDNINGILRILERICDIAHLAIDGMKDKELLDEWDQVIILFRSIDFMKIGDINRSELSYLKQSIEKYLEIQKAKQRKTELSDAIASEIKEIITLHYHGKYVKFQKEGSNSILEIFHDIYIATVNTIELDNAIKSNEIKYELSEKWSGIGRRIQEINDETILKIPHPVANKCFELSIKLNEDNHMSWCGIGWISYYIGLYTGDNSLYSKARNSFRNSIRIKEEKGNNYIPFLKFGIGETYEREGDATSAANYFNDSFNTLIESPCESKEAVELLLKTAESLDDLKFLDVSKDEKIQFMKDALNVYKNALNLALSICPTDILTFSLILKIQLLEMQNLEVEKKHEVSAVTIPYAELLIPKKSSNEIFEKPINYILSQISNHPEDYDLFKKLIESEFGNVMRSKIKIRHNLFRLVSNSLKQASKEFPFEKPSQIFQHCQRFCEDSYDEYEKKKFTDFFNDTVISRFRKIVFGYEYDLGPIESEDELMAILNKYEDDFGKIGVKIPKPDEIKNECESNKYYEKHKERLDRIFSRSI